MLARRGYGLVRTFGYSLAMSLAQLPGYLTAVYLVERIGRRPSLLAFFAGSAVAAAAFALFAPSTAWLLASGVALNFFNPGAWGLIYTYTPEVLPVISLRTLSVLEHIRVPDELRRGLPQDLRL